MFQVVKLLVVSMDCGNNPLDFDFYARLIWNISNSEKF